MVAITAEAPQIEVPAAISSASRRSTPKARPSLLVTTKVANSVTRMITMPVTPTAATCCVVNCSPSRMMASRSSRLRLNTTPARAIVGVPMVLCSAVPSRMAMIIGLKVPTPGMNRSR